jgi:hypothetical protein
MASLQERLAAAMNQQDKARGVYPKKYSQHNITLNDAERVANTTGKANKAVKNRVVGNSLPRDQLSRQARSGNYGMTTPERAILSEQRGAMSKVPEVAPISDNVDSYKFKQRTKQAGFSPARLAAKRAGAILPGVLGAVPMPSDIQSFIADEQNKQLSAMDRIQNFLTQSSPIPIAPKKPEYL